MNPNDDEKDLRRRFETWREQEGQHAPEFQHVWARAKHAAASPRPASPAWGWRFALGGAAVALVVAGLWFAVPPGRGPVVNVASHAGDWDAQLASLENELSQPEPSFWTAPTDYLLASASDRDPSVFATP